MAETPLAPGDDESGDAPGPTADELLARARDLPAGTRYPNIVGDAGPTDIPPGADPPTGNAEFPPEEP